MFPVSIRFLWKLKIENWKSNSFYILTSAIHKVDIGDRDIRQIILDRTNGQADILTIDYHCDNVDKENSHLALLGILKHVLNGKWFIFCYLNLVST